MIQKLIEKKIKELSLNDINKFALTENIYLSSNELNIIYNHIKNDWKTLLYGDSNIIFNNLKNEINENNYIKIYNLFNKYKKMYKNYL